VRGQYDTIEKKGNSLIQHGKHSDRVYLMKLVLSDMPRILDDIDSLAIAHNYSKAFVKVPDSVSIQFENRGYEKEAIIPHFYYGEVSGSFLSKYYAKERKHDGHTQEIAEIIALAKDCTGNDEKKIFSKPEYFIALAETKDVNAMSNVYKKVFLSYPFPIHDPEYLRDTMQSHIDYFVVRYGKNIVALSSAEMDKNSLNVEMTDFATLPEYCRQGIAQWLLSEMEVVMKAKGMKLSYTIARAMSPGINITFSRCGYKYSGTLVNNTNISGNIESMNVWYKNI